MVNAHTFYAIAVMALITALLRFLPFLIFKGKASTPALVEKLGRLLPGAVIAMLVVYCLKDMNFSATADYLPAIIAGLLTGVLHVWKGNTLLSVISGTVCYMLLVQYVF
ncbi:MAG: AzlD domain-containing protein [Akkermansia sp.]|nr:AzlD domain-containing protein [Akkermansia sp.]